jgi:hypothetical protein
MKPKLTNVAKCCFIFFLLNCFIAATAQSNKNPVTKIYLQGTAGSSSRSGDYGELSLQGVVKNKWSFTLSYHDLKMKPKNLPSDYQAETGVVLFIPYTDNVKVNMKLFSITAGKYFKLGRNSWLTTEAGFSIVNGEKASFQKTASQDMGFLFFWGTTSNYKTTIEKKTAAGGMFRADFTWAFCRFMGLGTGVFANFNSIQSPIGFNVKLTMGAMGWHKKLKTRK